MAHRCGYHLQTVWVKSVETCGITLKFSDKKGIIEAT